MPRPLASVALALMLFSPGCTTDDPVGSETVLPPTGAVLVRVEVVEFGSQPVAGAQITFSTYPPSGGCTFAASVKQLNSGNTDSFGILVQLVEGIPIAWAGSCLSVVVHPPTGSGLIGANRQVLVFPESTTPTDTTNLYVGLL